jgi:hypothetical protein
MKIILYEVSLFQNLSGVMKEGSFYFPVTDPPRGRPFGGGHRNCCRGVTLFTSNQQEIFKGNVQSAVTRAIVSPSLLGVTNTAITSEPVLRYHD